MARLKFSDDRDVPLWGATKSKGKKLQRERDLLNRIHELEVALADEKKLREAESTRLRQLEMYQAMHAPREKKEIDALHTVLRIPFDRAVDLGIYVALMVLLEWTKRLETVVVFG